MTQSQRVYGSRTMSIFQSTAVSLPWESIDSQVMLVFQTPTHPAHHLRLSFDLSHILEIRLSIESDHFSEDFTIRLWMAWERLAAIQPELMNLETIRLNVLCEPDIIVSPSDFPQFEDWEILFARVQEATSPLQDRGFPSVVDITINNFPLHDLLQRQEQMKAMRNSENSDRQTLGTILPVFYDVGKKPKPDDYRRGYYVERANATSWPSVRYET